MFIKTSRKTKTEMARTGRRRSKKDESEKLERRCKDRRWWNEIVEQAKTHRELLRQLKKKKLKLCMVCLTYRACEHYRALLTGQHIALMVRKFLLNCRKSLERIRRMGRDSYRLLLVSFTASFIVTERPRVRGSLSGRGKRFSSL